MPMRMLVTSGAGSVPAACDALLAAVGAVDGVAAPPPHATASRPTAAMMAVSFLVRSCDMDDTSFSSHRTRTYSRKNVSLVHHIVYNLPRIRCGRPSPSQRRTHPHADARSRSVAFRSH